MTAPLPVSFGGLTELLVVGNAVKLTHQTEHSEDGKEPDALILPIVEIDRTWGILVAGPSGVAFLISPTSLAVPRS